MHNPKVNEIKALKIWIKLVSLFILSLTIIGSLYAQDSSKPYEKYKILLKSGEHKIIEKGILKDTALIDITNENESLEIAINDIQTLEHRKGNLALKGLLIGTLVGAVIASLVELGNLTSDFWHYNEEDGKIRAIAITISGAAIGLLVGITHDNWMEIPVAGTLNAGYYKGNYQLSYEIKF